MAFLRTVRLRTTTPRPIITTINESTDSQAWNASRLIDELESPTLAVSDQATRIAVLVATALIITATTIGACGVVFLRTRQCNDSVGECPPRYTSIYNCCRLRRRKDQSFWPMDIIIGCLASAALQLNVAVSAVYGGWSFGYAGCVLTGSAEMATCSFTYLIAICNALHQQHNWGPITNPAVVLPLGFVSIALTIFPFTGLTQFEIQQNGLICALGTKEWNPYAIALVCMAIAVLPIVLLFSTLLQNRVETKEYTTIASKTRNGGWKGKAGTGIRNLKLPLIILASWLPFCLKVLLEESGIQVDLHTELVVTLLAKSHPALITTALFATALSKDRFRVSQRDKGYVELVLIKD